MLERETAVGWEIVAPTRDVALACGISAGPRKRRMTLSGVPRAFEILDETLGGEVKAELESFAGNKTRRESVGLDNIRRHRRYVILAPLHEWDLFCFVG